MLAQSKEVRDAWRASQRTLDVKVIVGGKTYAATDINSLKYDSGAYTGDTFAIGSTYSNSVQIEFSHLVENLKLGMEVVPSIGIKTSSGYVYEPLGVFIISSEIKMDRNNNLTTISASDRFCGLEGAYKSKLAYPAKVLDVVAEICAQSGVKANVDDLSRLPHQEDLPAPIAGQTYRKALGWIAQLYAGYATFDRQGLFTIRTIAEPNYELDPSQYEQAGLTKNEAPYKISCIQCQVTTNVKTRDGEDTEETKTLQVGDTNGAQIKLENNIMTAARLNAIWEQLKDITFYPFSLNWFGNPAVEAGDWLRLKDKQGNSFVVPNNSYTLDFNGGLSATSKADQTTSSDQMVPWQGSVAQAIKELRVRRAPDGTVIFPPSVSEPPKNAKFNDVWFRKNGNATELWVFEKQDDGTGKWVRKDLSDGEIRKMVEQAQSDLNQAKVDIITNKQKADTDIENLNKSIEANKKTADDSLQKLSDSITKLQGQYDNNIVPDLTKVTNDVADALQKYISAQNSIADLTKQAQAQGKNIADVTKTVDGLNINYANLLGDVNSTKVDVKGMQTTLGNASGDIVQLKLDAQNLQVLLAGKVDNATYTNFVNLTNQALNAKLTASDLNGYAKTADLQATANGLQANLNSVTGKLDNMVLGSRNLIRNSGFPQTNDFWDKTATVSTHPFYYDGTQKLFCINNSTANEIISGSTRFKVKRNTDYVFSFKGFQSWNVINYDVWFLARKNGEASDFTYSKPIILGQRLSNGSLQYVKDIVFNSGDNDEAYIRFDNNGSNDGNNSVFFFGEVKLEEGNKSTAWTPAPEDEKQRVDDIASQLSARITATSQQFSSYYTKAESDNRTNNAKNEAINSIKNDGNWQGLSNILTNSGFLQTADGFLQKVQQTAQPMINANNGGGINLVKMSGFHNVTIDQLRPYWDIGNDIFINTKGGRNATGSIVIDARNISDGLREFTQWIELEPNTDYHLSFHLLFAELAANSSFSAYTYLVEYDEQGNTTYPYRDNNRLIANTDDRSQNSFTIHTGNTTKNGLLYVRAMKGTKIELEEIKLEKGHIGTPWSPAPSDFATQISFSELSQSLEGLRSTVGSNYGSLQSQISQSSSAVRTDLIDKINGVQNQVTTTANGLDAKIGAIRIGGTNLIRNSGNFKNTDYWACETYGGQPGQLVLGKHAFWKNGQENLLEITNWNTNSTVVAKSTRFNVKANTTYTISFIGFHDVNLKDYTVYFLGRKYGSGNDYDVTVPIIVGQKLSAAHSTYVKVSFNTGNSDEGYIRFDNNGVLNNGQPTTLYLADIKVEEGTLATDWSPSSDDTDKAFAEVNAAINGLKSTVSGNYGDLQNQISQTNQTTRNEINDKVNGLQGQLTLQANNFNVALNNLQVGGTNLVRNSGDFQTLDYWSGTRLSLTKHQFWKNGKENLLCVTNSSATQENLLSSAYFDVKPNTTYTVSFWVFHDSNLRDYDVYFLGRKYGSPNGFDVVMQPVAGAKASAAYASYVTKQFNTGNSDEGYIRFDNNAALNDGQDTTLYLADIKVEEGDKATAWSPSPYDQVAKDQILAQINMSAGTTLIQNDKIYMDASSTVFSGNAFIPSAAITSLNADKITTGTLNAANVNIINLNANNITAGTLRGSNGEFYLDSGSLHVWQGNHNSWIDKNGIHDYENGNDTWIQRGQLAVTNSNNEGFFTKNGNIELTSRELYNSDSKVKYGKIMLDQNFMNTGGWGMNIIGRSGWSIRTDNYSGDDGWIFRSMNPTTGSMIGGNEHDIALKAQNVIELKAGKQVKNGNLGSMQPYIDVGNDFGGINTQISMFSDKLSWINGGAEAQFNLQGKSSPTGGEFRAQTSSNSYLWLYTPQNGSSSFLIFVDGKQVMSYSNDYLSTTASNTTANKLVVNKDLVVFGSKNAAVLTSRGMAAINAYETAEYYFGDIGEAVTNSDGELTVMIDPFFLETVNTVVPYQVFLTSYGDANVWIASRSANCFVVKSSKPNIHFAWEIKAKRKGYENDRMEIVKGVN